MTSPVQLYVYDLSNGLASQLSLQLTGRRIDGIWHTSVIVFGKEIFYGQGILITKPGQSHHGSPLQIVEMGETAIDEDTFNEYLEEMREHYTADKYHLLDFNCNSFTNDVVGFLTGGSIPDFIKDLPADFLSTPFGAALRPTIDAMFRRPIPGQPLLPPSRTAQDAQLVTPILQSVASQAQAQAQAPVPPRAAQAIQPANASSITAPMHIITNPASFNSFLKSHRAAAAMFTSQTCPPCRMIEPVFERLAEEKGLSDGRQGVAFAKIDIDVGLGRNVAAEWNIRATPTIYFFLDGQKKAELKGADAAELRTQVDLLIFEAYPPHPHTRLDVPHVQKLSLKPILFTQAPSIDTIVNKFFSFLDEASWPTTLNLTREEAKTAISKSFSPYLKARFNAPKTMANGSFISLEKVSSTPTALTSWSQLTTSLAPHFPPKLLFPLVDMWRLTFLDPATGSWASSTSPCGGPLNALIEGAVKALDPNEPIKETRNYILTLLRCLCNSFSSTILTQKLLTEPNLKGQITAVLVQSLLHEDASVKTAAASLTFNAGAWLQERRVEAVGSGKGIQADAIGEDEEWQAEIIAALIEALARETGNEEVVHRLTASLSLFIRCSPFYENQVQPLLEALQVRETLKGKLVKGDGWNGDGGVSKKEVRQLIEEVAHKLC